MFYPSLVAVFASVPLWLKQPRFVAETIDSPPGKVHGMAIGDVDGDGRPDIILADSSQVSWYRNGDWKRFVMMDAPSGQSITCIAMRDLNGDGRVEIAVGADGVYYLVPPNDPTELWTPTPISKAHSTRSIHWVGVGNGSHQLVVLPGDNGNYGQPTDLLAYEVPEDVFAPWKQRTIGQPMPQAHHLTLHDYEDREVVYISGDSGLMGFSFKDGRWVRNTADWLARGRPIHEAHIGTVMSRNARVAAAIEPPNRSLAALYTPGLTDSLLVYDKIGRVVLDRKMNDGHGLRMADLLGIGRDQAVVGWRTPNEAGLFGIKLYVPFNQYWEAIDVYWIDYKGIACLGLEVADLDGDGRPDIIAYGDGTTPSLKIYWNRTE